MEIGIDHAQPGSDRSVLVHRTPNFDWCYELQPGDSWAPHPAGGVVIVNPERKPVWCHVSDDGTALVQEILEPAGPDEQLLQLHVERRV